MAPSRLSTAVDAAIRSSTGTCSVAMWPPMKLYLGKPFHLRAGAGVSGARRGATSKGAVMGGSSLAWPIAGLTAAAMQASSFPRVAWGGVGVIRRRRGHEHHDD